MRARLRFSVSARIGAGALLAALSCAREPPSEQGLPAAAASVAPAPTSNVNDAETGAQAALDDTAFQAFEAAAAKAAGADEETLDAAETQRRFDQLRDYCDARAQALSKTLDPGTRRHFLAATTDVVSGDWNPSWSQLVENAVRITDAAAYAGGPWRRADATRADARAGWLTGLAMERLYRIDCFVQRRAGDFASHVRVSRPRGEVGKRTRAELVGLYRRALTSAPEAADADDGCRRCALADQDLEKSLRSLRAFEAEATTAADGQCRAWPELTQTFGGPQACRNALELYFSAFAAGDGLATRGRTEAPVPTNEPPARDPAYARFAGPIHQSCAEDGMSDANRHAEIESCFVGELNRRLAKLRTSSVKAHARFAKAWATFQGDLCQADDLLVNDLSVLGGDRAYRHCGWLAPLRAAFVLDVWTRNAISELKAHVQSREAWAEARVSPGLSRLEQLASRAPCPRAVHDAEHCRTSLEPARRWAHAAPAIRRLRADASQLARVTCEEWRSTSAIFGAQCRNKLTSYYLSYAQNVGKLRDLPVSPP